MINRKIKYLEFIQGTINRLASNSFRMKGYCVVLVSTLFIGLALSAVALLIAFPEAFPKHTPFLLLGVREELVAGGLIPVIFFWGLDGYFLWQERLFRALYDSVRVLEEDQIDFSMDVSPFKTGHPRTWPSATFSRTLLVFYGALAVVILAIAFS